MKRPAAALAAAQQTLRRAEKDRIDRLYHEWYESVPRVFAREEFTFDYLLEDLHESVRTSLRAYLRSPEQFLILHGGVGTGKTTLAVALIGELIDQGSAHNPLMMNCQKMFTGFSFDDDRKTERQVMNADYLIIDDAGAGTATMTDHQHRGLFSVIDSRWSSGLARTIITTNLPISSSDRTSISLSEWFDTPAWDRISDSVRVVNVKGDSRRG